MLHLCLWLGIDTTQHGLNNRHRLNLHRHRLELLLELVELSHDLGIHHGRIRLLLLLNGHDLVLVLSKHWIVP